MSPDKATSQVEKWTLRPAFTLPKKQELVEMDDDTRAYDEECTTIVAEARSNPTERSVNIALLKLQDEFWWRYESATPAQKHISNNRNRMRTTLFDVFRAYYLELLRLRRKVTPLLHESTPPPEPEPQFQGIYLGKDLGPAFE